MPFTFGAKQLCSPFWMLAVSERCGSYMTALQEGAVIVQCHGSNVSQRPSLLSSLLSGCRAEL